MECPGGVLGEIKVGYWAGEVDWLSLWTKQLLTTKVFNRESQVVKDLLPLRLASKIKTILRQEAIDGLLRELRFLRIIEKSEQSQHQIGSNWEVTSQVWKLGRQKVGSAVHVDVLEHDITEQIETTTTSTTSCLTEVEGIEVDGVAGEDNCGAGHVDTQRQLSSGDNNAEETLAEQDFDTLPVLLEIGRASCRERVF